MKLLRYDYTLSDHYDTQTYQNAKQYLRTAFPEFIERQELIDELDGDAVQIFECGEDEIRLVNDFFVGAVYVKSTVKIEFPKISSLAEAFNNA